jgi:DNA-binding transcriptional LysR family regulator
MIDDLRSIAIFAEAIKSGSFRGAAGSLGLSPSVVSYHVTQLEQSMGTALIYRSTRKLSLTHEGEILYRHATDMLGSIQLGINKVASRGHEATGKLKLSIPSALARSPLNRQLAQFSKQHRKINLEILYTDLRQDLIASGLDLVVRAGDMEDSSLKSKRIGAIERKLVCSSEYMQNREVPAHPDDLVDWNWVKLAMLPNLRQLRRKNQPPVQIEFGSNISVDSVDAMTQLCIYGLGIATPPDYLVESALKSGDLIELLPAWKVDAIPLYACWPGNVSDSSNTKRLLHFLTG